MPITAPWNTADAGSGRSNSWDTLIIEDVPIPGLAKITGSIGVKIDVQPVKGQKGAKTTNEGPDPAKLTIELRLSSIEDVHELEGILDSIHPRKLDQKGAPVRITHPSANFHGIDRILIQEISLPTIDGDRFVLSIKAIEYFEAPKAAKTTTSKPKGSTYERNLTGTSGAGNDPYSVMQRQPAPNPFAGFPDPEVGWV